MARLNGTAAHHKKKTLSDAKKATREFLKAEKLASRGKCGVAMAALLEGSERYGRALAHEEEAGEGGVFFSLDMKKAMLRKDDAKVAFRSRCGPK